MPTETEVNDLLTRLARTPTRVLQAAAGLNEEQVRQRPAEGEWSIAEVFAHLRASDDILASRFLPILARDEPPLAVYDERAWAETAHYAQARFRESLEIFSLRRAEIVEVLRQAPLAAWERTGVREQFGPISVLELARSLVEHEEEHEPHLLALRAGIPDAPPIVGPEAAVSLREMTQESLRSIIALKVAPNQQQFVASNTVSLAEAHFYNFAWFRAIYADETPVGFIMIADQPEKSEYFLWRLMIAAEHQGKGYGRQALHLLIAHVRTRPNATELLVSYEPGVGSPRDFYYKLGFQETGQELEGEIVLRLPL